ncbi:hypothetical protein, partial [Pseudomonas juntendi]|uniref:hypothetical protein n=1 Tax=Pseudomonas juntendi TaxID=2666183 RepID=UPI00244B5160
HRGGCLGRRHRAQVVGLTLVFGSIAPQTPGRDVQNLRRSANAAVLSDLEKVPGESREREHVLCFLQRDDEKSMFEFITP